MVLEKSKSQIVNDIISKRKTTAAEPKQKKEQLESLEASLRKLEAQKQTILNKPGITSNLVKRLEQINFSVLIEKAIQEQQVWENLWKRFKRDSVNIGVVGLAREGKSTKLQKVSGLTNDEIPTSDGQPCTAVQSNIHHSEGETYGWVHFHSEQSFLEEVIKPYYQALGFSNYPQTLDQFCNTLLPEEPVVSGESAKIKSIYKHLKNYHSDCVQNRGKYRERLKKEKWELKITKSEIKKYVSQEYDSDGNPKNFEHLVVEKVDIYCPFPHNDVQQIALIDMPGLGDTRLGDGKRMISALGQDVDFILFIRRPISKKGDFWKPEDVNLYDTASKALNEKLPLEEWSFMLLNHDGDNTRLCNEFENTRIKNGILVKKCLIANCKDYREANNALEEVLTYLVDNIVRLDKQYMSASQSSLKSLQFEIEQELTKAKEIIEDYGDGHTEYVPLKNSLKKQLYEKIENFREELREKKDQPNSDFKTLIDEAIQQCQNNSGVPQRENFEIEIPEKGINAVYFKYIQQVRARFLRHFHLIETGLKDFLVQTKSDVTDIFIDLGFGNLTEKKGAEFLRTMAEELPQNLSNLKLGFNFISSFELSYRGFIQLSVWEAVEDYFPSSPGKPVYIPNDLTLEETKNYIIDRLQESYEQALDSCEKVLNEFAVSVTEVNVSMVEEFADHITRAEEIEEEWDIFLGKNRSLIWSEFQNLEERKQLQQQWINLVTESLSINQKL